MDQLKQTTLYHKYCTIFIHRSRYFATALTTGVGNAKSKSELEVKECSPEVLICIVDFMYGIPIPEDFEDTKGLLHQADLFLMEDLKSAVGFLIAKTLSLNTVKDLFPLGEKYREVVLQESCSDFILAHIEEIEDSVLSELDLSLITKRSLQAIKDTKRDSEEKIAMAERHADEKIAEAEERCEEGETKWREVSAQLKKCKSELEAVTGVKNQLKAKLKDYKSRLENVASMEETRAKVISKLEEEKREAFKEKNSELMAKWSLDRLELLTNPLNTTFLA